MKNIFHGNIIVKANQNQTIDYDVVTGFVVVYYGATLNAPNLKLVGFSVCVNRGATIIANNLTSIGVSVYIEKFGTLVTPKLTIVGNNVTVFKRTVFYAPNLTIVGCNVCVKKGATLILPVLTIVGGNINVNIDGGFKGGKNINKFYNKINGFTTPDGKYIFADGIVGEIIEQSEDMFHVRKIGRLEVLYLCTDGDGNYSHGSTPDEAKSDLVFKILNRNSLSYKNLKLTDKLTRDEAIICYMTITKADCLGVKFFIENSYLNCKSQTHYTISEIILITKGRWGNECFKKFFS